MQQIAIAIGITAGMLVLGPLLLGLWFLWMIHDLRSDIRRLADASEALLEHIETHAGERRAEMVQLRLPVDR